MIGQYVANAMVKSLKRLHGYKGYHEMRIDYYPI